MDVEDQWSWEEAAFKEEGTKEEEFKEEGTKEEGGTKGDNLSSGHDEELRADEQRCTLKLSGSFPDYDFWGWVSLYLK